MADTRSRDRLSAIWHLTWPQVSMLLCQFAIGITDVWTSGRIGAEVQATVGLINQAQMVLMALVLAASSGAVAAVSQSLGAGRGQRARRYIALVVYGCIGLGMGLALAAYGVRYPFLRLLRTPAEMLPVATLFLGVYLWSLPGQYAMSIGASVFRAAQSVKKPLYASMLAAVANIFGDLAFGLGWWGFPACGADGVAWSTFVSVWLGAGTMMALLARDGLLQRAVPGWRWIRAGAPYLVKVAAPALGTSLLWQIGYMVMLVLTATLPQGSVTALAGLTAGLRIEALLFLPAVAFNMTASVLVGHALGQGNPAEARRLMLQILGLACGVMSLVGACMWPWRAELAALLAPDPAVQAQIVAYLRFNIPAVPFTVGSVVLAGVLGGAGATIYPMLAYGITIWLVRLPLAWYMGHEVWQSAEGVYLSMLVSQILQSSSLLWVVLRCNWTRFSMLGQNSQHCHRNARRLR